MSTKNFINLCIKNDKIKEVRVFSDFRQKLLILIKLFNNWILINLLYQLMNFETSQPFDKQLRRLLAMIILCQKKIQELKKKLAGNQQFHTRLIFERMDFRKKGEITPQDIVYCLSTDNYAVNLLACQYLCRKYTVSGAINYEQLLALIIPKTDKALAQRMLIRTTKRGATLPNYLWKYFTQLFVSIISMTVITEEIRRNIQNCADLNHLQMVQFFRILLRSPEAIWRFCNSNENQEYDFTINDTNFLSNNIRSGNQLYQMTDEDIKEIICPVDMNFQKTVHQMAPYYQNIKAQKYRTIKGAFFQQTKAAQNARMTASTNFLNSNYRSMYPNANKLKQNRPQNYGHGQKNNFYNIQSVPQRQSGYVQNIRIVDREDSMLLKPSRVLQGSKMYLDNFIKPLPFDQNISGGIQLDRFLSGRNARNAYQKFDDNLPQNLDSSYSNSAFVQY